VAIIQQTQLADFFDSAADLARLLSLDDGLANLPSSLDPAARAIFVWNGSQLALPLCGGNLVIYLNRACFDRAVANGAEVALPSAAWTMDEFLAMARSLTRDFDHDGRTDQYGLWMPSWVYYLPFIWSFGADLADPAGRHWAFQGSAAHAAAGFYRTLAEQVSPDDAEVVQLFQDTAFLTGKVAMCVNGPWFQAFLAKTNLADSYVVLPIPRGPAGSVTRVAWDGIVMSDNLPPPRRDAAASFIRYLLSDPVQSRIAQTGRAIPARLSSRVAFEEGPDRTRRAVFLQALSGSRPQPLFSRFSEVDRALGRHFDRLRDPGCSASIAQWLDGLAKDPAIAAVFSEEKGQR